MLNIPRNRLQILTLFLASAITVGIGVVMKKTSHIPSPAVLMGPSIGCKTDALFYFIGTTGIGLDTSGKEEYPTVARVDADTPAEKSGIKVGDSVLQIDGQDTLLMTNSSMNKKMFGEKWTPISLKLRNSLGCVRSVSLLRARVVDVHSDEEKWAAHAFWANQNYTGFTAGEHNIEVPYILYHERMKQVGPVAIEFYSKDTGPCKHAPAVFRTFIQGLQEGTGCGPNGCRRIVTYPQNPTIGSERGSTLKFCIDDPVYRELAVRIGINTAPATLFWIHDQPIIFESRIVKSVDPNSKPVFLEGPMKPYPGDALYNFCGYYGTPAHN